MLQASPLVGADGHNGILGLGNFIYSEKNGVQAFSAFTISSYIDLSRLSYTSNHFSIKMSQFCF